MNASRLKEQSAGATPASVPTHCIRVGIVCDFAEENWPSMDLVADMLAEHMEFPAARLQPPMQPHLARLPWLRHQAFFRNADRLFNRFVDYPRWLQKNALDFDIFHLVDHSYAQLLHHLPADRTVVTCHDLDTFRCLLDPAREKRPRWFRAMTGRILKGFQKAAHVIAVSASTRDEILRHGLMPADRVTVIPNGVHPSCSPEPDRAADTQLVRLLPPNFGNGPCLLNVGSTMRRKRIDLLLRVFAAIRADRPDAILLRVGGPFTPAQLQLARELGVENAIIQLPVLSRDVLASAYRRADLLVHTAEAEGFGLPLIEALACGCPVAASDLPVLREVGGVAATYCRVEDISAWKDAVLQILDENSNPVQRREHRHQGISQAARFSWLQNARRTALIYQQVLNAKTDLAATTV